MPSVIDSSHAIANVVRATDIVRVAVAQGPSQRS